MRVTHNNKPVIRLEIRRHLLVLGSGTHHIIMFSILLVHGRTYHVQLGGIHHQADRSTRLQSQYQLAFRNIGSHLQDAFHRHLRALVQIGNPLFLSGKPFLQIPLQQLLPVLTLILPVQFIVILLNGCGQNCRQLHHPLSSARTGQSHQVEIGGINHTSIIHPHPRQATADVGNHGEQQNIPLALVADVRQTTLQKVGQTVEQFIRKTRNFTTQLVSLKFL